MQMKTPWERSIFYLLRKMSTRTVIFLVTFALQTDETQVSSKLNSPDPLSLSLIKIYMKMEE